LAAMGEDVEKHGELSMLDSKGDGHSNHVG
jgi:hypothetical protein